MATIDLTLNSIKIPALDGYTPPFGTKKVSGGLSTQEVNDNIIAGFLKQRPVEITEDSTTGSVEYNASLVLTTSGLTLYLGAGAYTGCEVKVLFPSGGSMQYTGKTGTVTDALQAGATIRYLWTGTYWKSISCPVEIGDVYTQLPDVAAPAAIYGGQWVEHDYGGMFFRSAGGNAKAFTTPIAGSFSSGTVFAASAALPAGVAAGDLVIAGSEYRTISSISGQNITIDSAFTNFSNITNLLIGQKETLPDIVGQFMVLLNITSNALGTNAVQGAFYNVGGATQSPSRAAIAGSGSGNATMGFAASKTTGTGSGVYKTDAHVLPNNISCKAWLRRA